MKTDFLKACDYILYSGDVQGRKQTSGEDMQKQFNLIDGSGVPKSDITGRSSKYGSVPIQWLQRFLSLVERRLDSEALTFMSPRLHGTERKVCLELCLYRSLHD